MRASVRRRAAAAAELGGCDTFQTSANECKHRWNKDNTVGRLAASAERVIQSIFQMPLACHNGLIILIIGDG